MRIIKVLVELPMILLFGTLRFAVNIISKIYCRAASLVWYNQSNVNSSPTVWFYKRSFYLH